MRSFENKIDEGLQYHVLEVDENTVRKVPKTEREMIETIESWESQEEKTEKLVRKGIRRREKAVQKMKTSRLPLKELFAVKYIEGREVYQQKLTPVDQVSKEFEEIVDDYINLLHRLWRHGIGDTIYNFTINNGYGDRRIFQMDFGEVVFEKKTVLEAVKEEKWLHQWTLGQDLAENEKEYFKQRMNERLTVEKLRELWKTQKE